MQFRPYLCAMCSIPNAHIPRDMYSIYFNQLVNMYLPYYTLYARRWYDDFSDFPDPQNADRKQRERELKIQNYIRKVVGYPPSPRPFYEYYLLKIIRKLAAPSDVIHRYRGRELDGLELDFWIPDRMLGIEYNGEQHYKTVAHWGGDEGLKTRKANDRKKKALCKKLGYRLVVLNYRSRPDYSDIEELFKENPYRGTTAL
ncbi:hypothetical protein [Ephemeroptericola cinctiostellae]|nr:hypothetical protein [Ephemeroptericola cinctiostellae]